MSEQIDWEERLENQVREEDSGIVYPEVVLYGDQATQIDGEEPPFPDSPHEARDRAEAERATEDAERERAERALRLWAELGKVAHERMGKNADKALDAYRYVKLGRRANSADYAEQTAENGNNVRGWIAKVDQIAYGVGLGLHDKVFVGPGGRPEIQHLRDLVSKDAGSPEAWSAYLETHEEFADDPYVHLSGGHIHRARQEFEESIQALVDGCVVTVNDDAVHSMLLNAMGMTYWEPTHPATNRLELAKHYFQLAIKADSFQYYAYLNLAKLALDAGSLREAKFWFNELGAKRKDMTQEMRDNCDRYLQEAGWTKELEDHEFWKRGPKRWITGALKRGAILLPVILAYLLMGAGVAIASGVGGC